jgi:hypothetical protein
MTFVGSDELFVIQDWDDNFRKETAIAHKKLVDINLTIAWCP